jgi:hypothetical protein
VSTEGTKSSVRASLSSSRMLQIKAYNWQRHVTLIDQTTIMHEHDMYWEYNGSIASLHPTE